MDPAAAQAKAEATIAGGLLTVAGLAHALQYVSLVASTIAAICGAIMGLHAVYRLVKSKRAARQ